MMAEAFTVSMPRDGNVSRATTSASTSGPSLSNSGNSDFNTPSSLQSFQVPAPKTKEIDNILLWPAAQALLSLDGVEPSQWNNQTRGADGWLESISSEVPNLAVDRAADILYSEFGVLILNGRSISLNKAYVDNLCAAYFGSFHYVYPMLNLDQFYDETLPRVCSQSFSEDSKESSLVLLVLALGSVAQAGATGNPILDETGKETGLRGGTIVRPPGHMFLTEAKRRIGLALTSWDLSNLQCAILFASVFLSGAE